MISAAGCVGIWSALHPSGSQFFTSVLYPFDVSDSLSITMPLIVSGFEWTVPHETMHLSQLQLEAGTLTVTIVYITYNNPLYIDTMHISQLQLEAGTLVQTIVYVSYHIPAEPIDVASPVILSGTLDVLIDYITYNNWTAEPIDVASPVILSGTLA